MLFMAPDASKLERIQGTYLSDDEINKLVRYWRGIRTYDSSQLRVEDETAPNAPPALDTSSYANRSASQPPPAGAPPSTSLPPASGLPNTPMSQPPLFEQIEQLRAVDARDKLFEEAVRIYQEHGTVSINLLQRRLRVGYGRAARLVDQLREAGIIDQDRPASPEPPAPRSSSAPAQPPAQPPAQTPGQPPAPRIIGGTGEGGDAADDQSNPPSRFWM